jgi:hypothetical protein
MFDFIGGAMSLFGGKKTMKRRSTSRKSRKTVKRGGAVMKSKQAGGASMKSKQAGGRSRKSRKSSKSRKH